MTRKLALILLATALPFTGCKKIGEKIPFLKKKETAAATPAPAPAPAVVAPEPKPAEPVAPALNLRSSTIVLCYHNIEDGGKMKALTISIGEFEKELQAIKDNGFAVIPMQDFLAWRRGEKEIPVKSCVITIDDGWVSAYDNAWPLLKKYRYPFTLFVYVNYVGTGGKSMTWTQLAEMRDAGVDIQSHTYSHSNLRFPGGGMDRTHAEEVKREVAAMGVDGWLRKEIVTSKEVIEKQLGIKCNAFAYPFGVYSPKAREMVKEAGYEAAFTVYGQQIRNTSPPADLLGRYALEAAKPQIFAEAMKMVGGGVSGEPLGTSSVGQLAAASMLTQPKDGEVVTDPTPTIKANMATFGEIDPASVEMRVSGYGPVPAKYDPATKTVEYKVAQKLREPGYTVFLSAKVGGVKKEVKWTFTFDPTGSGAPAPEDAPLPPRAGSAPATPAAVKIATPKAKKK